MSCGLPREVLKWILSIDLSYAVKNPKRDFANGFLYAEILSRYYPSDVQMHSFENVASMERKKANWALLEKVMKRKRIPVERGQIEAVMAAEGDAALEVLQTIFTFIHSPSYEASKTQGPSAQSPECSAAAQQRDRGYDASTSSQPDYVPLPSQYEKQQQVYGQHLVPGAMYIGGGAPGGVRSAAAAATTMQPGGNPAIYKQVATGLEQQQQQYQQQHSNGYGAYEQMQQQQQVAGQGPAAADGGYGYGYSYGYHSQQQGVGAAGPAAGYAMPSQQQQQQRQLAPAFSPGQSVSPGSGGTHLQQQTAQVQQQQQQAAMPAMPVAAGGGYAAAYALAYAEQMRQQAMVAGYSPDQQQLVYQQALYQYQQQAAMAAMGSGGAAAQQSAGTGPSSGAQVSPEREGLPFSRKPRPVDFKPYDLKDFEEKEYNAKAGRSYWQLGKLGPDLETEELQAKREAKERIKKMADQVREDNARRANSRPRQRPPAASDFAGAAAGGAGGGGGSSSAPGSSSSAPRDGKEKELSARERALQFAKNIPKPEPKLKKQSVASQSGEAEEVPILSELELLERQHQERQQEVDKIRAELARIL